MGWRVFMAGKLMLVAVLGCLAPAGCQRAPEPPALLIEHFEDQEAKALALNADTWRTPRLPVRELAYYQLNFSARFAGAGHWVARFYDAEGRRLAADNWERIEPSETWRQHVYPVHIKPGAASLEIEFGAQTSGSIDELGVTPIKRRTAAVLARRLYADVPPLRFQAPVAQAPVPARSLAKLASGGTLRLVLLGDSIMNDTSNSAFDAVLERLFPGSKVQLIASVEGGRGMWFFQDPQRIQRYVLDHQPDLVLIGGISHREDLDAIRKVIERIQAACEAEVVLLSGPFGEHDPADHPERSEPLRPDGRGFRVQQWQLAQRLNVPFFDLEGVWARYVLSSGHPCAWFMRDPIHANARGKQLLGRLLVEYFVWAEWTARARPLAAGF